MMLLSQNLGSYQARAVPAHIRPLHAAILTHSSCGVFQDRKDSKHTFEAKWPQDEIRANITESDKEYSSF